MGNLEKMKLSDDMLEGVSGGAGRQTYSDLDMKNAGVTIKTVNGKKQYYATLSNGKTVSINKNTALDMCDCYKVSGNVKIEGAQLDALIAQG